MVSVESESAALDQAFRPLEALLGFDALARGPVLPSRLQHIYIEHIVVARRLVRVPLCYLAQLRRNAHTLHHLASHDLQTLPGRTHLRQHAHQSTRLPAAHLKLSINDALNMTFHYGVLFALHADAVAEVVLGFLNGSHGAFRAAVELLEASSGIFLNLMQPVKIVRSEEVED